MHVYIPRVPNHAHTYPPPISDVYEKKKSAIILMENFPGRTGQDRGTSVCDVQKNSPR